MGGGGARRPIIHVRLYGCIVPINTIQYDSLLRRSNVLSNGSPESLINSMGVNVKCVSS